MTNIDLINHLKQYPDDADIYFEPDDGQSIVSMSLPTYMKDGNLEAVIFYCEKGAQKLVRRWVEEN